MGDSLSARSGQNIYFRKDTGKSGKQEKQKKQIKQIRQKNQEKYEKQRKVLAGRISKAIS